MPSTPACHLRARPQNARVPQLVRTAMSSTPYVFDVTEADFEEKVLVASTRVPVLVDFWAPWCAPCRQLTPILERLATEMKGQVLVAKVNTDNEQQLAAIFGIRSLPTVMVVRNGRPLDGFVGVQPESAIRTMLLPHLGDALPAEEEPEPPVPEETDLDSLIAELRARVAAEPDKGEHRIELAQALLSSGAVDEVEAIVNGLTGDIADGDAAKKLRAQLGFVHAVRGAPPPAELARAIDADPANLHARHQLGVHALLAGRPDLAFEQFLEIMRRDRKYEDDLGRRTLIQAMLVTDDADLVSATRRRMAALLF